MIAYEQRCNEDERTLGEIFFYFIDELADITFGESFKIIMEAMIESIREIFSATEDQLQVFLDAFFGRLPKYMQNALSKTAAA